MKTRIIAAFPLCGKTHCTETLGNCRDSDSSQFSWVEKDGKRERNPLFPLNYVIDTLNLANRGELDCIFISTHDGVLSLLDKMEVPYTLVYPENTPEAREEWLRRYDNREVNGFPRKVLEDNWDSWHDSMDAHAGAPNVQKVSLGTSQYLSDVL